MENHGKLQQETDQELVVEPTATFDCTHYFTMSKTLRC